MARHPAQPAKTFSVQQANAMLPLVRAIVTDLVRMSQDVLERRERLAFVAADRPQRPNDVYQEELVQMESDLEDDARRLQEYVHELQRLGVEPKSVTEGIVDFPTVIDGRPAYLCWRLGEPEVLYWHERDAGYRNRQPLAVGVGAGPEEGAPLSDFSP